MTRRPPQTNTGDDALASLEAVFQRQGHSPVAARKMAVKQLPTYMKICWAFAALAKGEHERGEQLLVDAALQHFQLPRPGRSESPWKPG